MDGSDRWRAVVTFWGMESGPGMGLRGFWGRNVWIMNDNEYILRLGWVLVEPYLQSTLISIFLVRISPSCIIKGRISRLEILKLNVC